MIELVEPDRHLRSFGDFRLPMLPPNPLRSSKQRLNYAR
jgi:hypothetical protein